MDRKKILFLDDDLNRHDKFKKYYPYAERVFTAQECIDALKREEWYQVYLDHDLGGETYQREDDKNTGSEVCRQIVEFKPKVDCFIIHSLNHEAAKNMKSKLDPLYDKVVIRPFTQLFGNFFDKSW